MLDHGQKHDDQYEMFDSKEDVIHKMIRKKIAFSLLLPILSLHKVQGKESKEFQKFLYWSDSFA